jgi:dolichol kinase
MIAEIVAAAGIAGLGVLGLAGANYLRDRGVDGQVSRRLAAVLGGGVYLLGVLLLDVWTVAVLSSATALLILGLRLRFREHLRGLSGAETGQRWGEVAYPIAGAASIVLGWGILGDKWMAFVPIAFMAWGDNAAGIVRARIASGGGASLWPSVAMLGFCLGIASLYQPSWIAAAGAIAATTAERFRPSAHPLWDDNWAIVVASLSVMAVLTWINL